MVKQTILVCTLTLLLSSCSNIPLKLLTGGGGGGGSGNGGGTGGGGGPNVAANTQVGKENTQNLGVISNTLPEINIEAPVETVIQDTSSVEITEVDPLMLLVLVLGWIAPSPSEIGRRFCSLFRRRKD